MRFFNLAAFFTLATLYYFIAQSASPTDQLKLALTWNRADIARREIFKKDQKWKVRNMYLLIVTTVF